MTLRLHIFLFFFIVFSTQIYAQVDEPTIKAYSLEKFTRWIDWANDKEFSEQEHFVIGIYGEGPIIEKAEQIYANQKIKNKNVIIRKVKFRSQIKGCNMLFICKSEKEDVKKIIEYSKNRPILTIASTGGYAKMGVHINIYFKAGNLRFQINDEAIKLAGLILNFNLLKLGEPVKTEEAS